MATLEIFLSWVVASSGNVRLTANQKTLPAATRQEMKKARKNWRPSMAQAMQPGRGKEGHSHATDSGRANRIDDSGSASPWRDARRGGIGGRGTQVSQQGGVLEPCPRVAGSAPEVRLRFRPHRRNHGPAHEGG